MGFHLFAFILFPGCNLVCFAFIPTACNPDQAIRYGKKAQLLKQGKGLLHDAFGTVKQPGQHGSVHGQAGRHSHAAFRIGSGQHLHAVPCADDGNTVRIGVNGKQGFHI